MKVGWGLESRGGLLEAGLDDVRTDSWVVDDGCDDGDVVWFEEERDANCDGGRDVKDGMSWVCVEVVEEDLYVK